MTYKIIFIAIVALSILNLNSCTKKDNPTSPKVDVPNITAISPNSAKIGEVITISGSAFGAAKGASFVSFNTTKATEYISWSNSMIKTIVPAGAISGKTLVAVNGFNSNEIDLTIIVPIVYESVTIGSQEWMRFDLSVERYRNGDSIPQVTDPILWDKIKYGAWCYYNNNPLNGKLYNWYAVNDPRGLAPVGWHIPSDAEWKTLEISLGMSQAQADATGYRGTDEGGKLKESGTLHWANPNKGATNESGFTALPGGSRYNSNYDLDSCKFRDSGYNGNYWCTTEYNTNLAYCRYLYVGESRISRFYFNKDHGMSVRCIKD